MGEPPRPCRCFDWLMVVIFGFGPGKQEDMGEAVQVVCPNCHNQVILHHVRSKKTVRLYFVPVVPYGTDDYLVCPVCSRGMQLSQAQLPHVASVKRATAAFRAGRLSEADYAVQADRFWRAMGGHVTGRPAEGRAGAPPAATEGTDDYLVCPVCSRGMQLSQAQLPHVASVKRATAAFRAGRLSEADYAVQADRFWRAMGVHVTGRPAAGSAAAPPPAAPAPPPPAAPAPPPAAAPTGQPPPAAEETSWMGQLRKLAKLHEEGVLSDAHYESAKQRILEQM